MGPEGDRQGNSNAGSLPKNAQQEVAEPVGTRALNPLCSRSCNARRGSTGAYFSRISGQPRSLGTHIGASASSQSPGDGLASGFNPRMGRSLVKHPARDLDLGPALHNEGIPRREGDPRPRPSADQTFLAQVVSAYIQSEFASVRTSSSVLDLFRTPAIRKVTCCLMVVW